MFWDDEMVEKVKSEYPLLDTQEKLDLLAVEIFNLAWDKMKAEIFSHKKITDYEQKAAVKRACILWKSAAEKMKKAGCPVLNADGFYKILESKPAFKDYLPKEY